MAYIYVLKITQTKENRFISETNNYVVIKLEDLSAILNLEIGEG